MLCVLCVRLSVCALSALAFSRFVPATLYRSSSPAEFALRCSSLSVCVLLSVGKSQRALSSTPQAAAAAAAFSICSSSSVGVCCSRFGARCDCCCCCCCTNASQLALPKALAVNCRSGRDLSERNFQFLVSGYKQQHSALPRDLASWLLLLLPARLVCSA